MVSLEGMHLRQVARVDEQQAGGSPDSDRANHEKRKRQAAKKLPTTNLYFGPVEPIHKKAILAHPSLRRRILRSRRFPNWNLKRECCGRNRKVKKRRSEQGNEDVSLLRYGSFRLLDGMIRREELTHVRHIEQGLHISV